MKKESIKSLVCVGLIFIAFILILYGIADKEVVTVFSKAVNICMECIGIG